MSMYGKKLPKISYSSHDYSTVAYGLTQSDIYMESPSTGYVKSEALSQIISDWNLKRIQL